MLFSKDSRALPAETQNALALKFGSLHKPSDPVLLANVYDIPTAKIVVAHPACKAIATASFAIAATHGTSDDDLSWDQNIESIRKIAAIVIPSGKPLTVDVQDGYDIPKTITEVIAAGAVGCNIEDVETKVNNRLRSLEEAVNRIREVKLAAAGAGVPDFVVNARTDTLLHGNSIDDAIERGKRFLEVGATTVFIWGGPKRGMSNYEVEQAVRSLGGRVNVKMNLIEGFLNVQELGKIGVARISVGPELYNKAIAAMKAGLELVLGSDI